MEMESEDERGKVGVQYREWYAEDGTDVMIQKIDSEAGKRGTKE